MWEFLGWENADKYRAGLTMVDNRSTAMSPEALDRKPTWRRLPAGRAGQTAPWPMEERYSYAGCAPVLERLAAAVRRADRLKGA